MTGDRPRRSRASDPCGFNSGAALLPGMSVLLQEGVQTGLIDAAGYAVLVGGVVLTALWLKSLYR